GDQRTIDRIKFVEYTLHPTFPNPVQRVETKGDPAKPFALTATDWGVFQVGIKVTFQDGRSVRLSHMLSFTGADPCTPEVTLDQEHYVMLSDSRFSGEVFVYVGNIYDRGKRKPTRLVIFTANRKDWGDSGKLDEHDFDKRTASNPPQSKWLLSVRDSGESLQFSYRENKCLLTFSKLKTTMVADRLSFKVCER